MIKAQVIGGRIGRDAEQRRAGDYDVVDFSVASTQKKKSGDITSWVRVQVWGNYGTALFDSLKKGELVSVEGELTVREYTDKDGNKRQSTEINASTVSVAFREGRDPGRVNQRSNEPSPGHESSPDDDIPF